ncbi:transposase [Pedococcus sp. NPDC057267]|uniref:transposase n=1 Tax=Pedococcus sp. NPDC057267 TaxID=3346077 RepID=UPI003630245D
MQAQGSTIPGVCKRLEISEQTFCRWRIRYGGLKEDEAQRLKALEAENARLKRIVAEQAWTRTSLRCRSGPRPVTDGEQLPAQRALTA